MESRNKETASDVDPNPTNSPESTSDPAASPEDRSWEPQGAPKPENEQLAGNPPETDSLQNIAEDNKINKKGSVSAASLLGTTAAFIATAGTLGNHVANIHEQAKDIPVPGTNMEFQLKRDAIKTYYGEHGPLEVNEDNLLTVKKDTEKRYIDGKLHEFAFHEPLIDKSKLAPNKEIGDYTIEELAKIQSPEETAQKYINAISTPMDVSTLAPWVLNKSDLDELDGVNQHIKDTILGAIDQDGNNNVDAYLGMNVLVENPEAFDALKNAIKKKLGEATVEGYVQFDGGQTSGSMLEIYGGEARVINDNKAGELERKMPDGGVLGIQPPLNGLRFEITEDIYDEKGNLDGRLGLYVDIDLNKGSLVRGNAGSPSGETQE